MSTRRIRAILRKELREYRRNGSIVSTMTIIPVIFVIPPLIEVFTSASTAPGHGDRLLYMLGIPALVPAVVSAYSVVGERQQGTLEPVLATPVRREELLLGKALAALLPSLVVSYGVYAIAVAVIELLARAAVASALVRGPAIVAQLIFTPLVAGVSIWAGIAISARSSDVRVATQLGVLVGLPSFAVAALIAFNVIHATLGLAVGLGATLLLLDGSGWRVVSMLLDRERLITHVS